jgi:hypothetical protein
MRSILSALVFFNLNGWYRAQHLALAGQLRSQSKLKCLSNSSRSRDSEDLRHKRRVNDHVWRDGVVAECMHPCIARTQR